MRKVGQGQPLGLTAQFRLSDGSLVDPDGPSITITDADDNAVELGVPSHVTLGTYSYVFNVSALTDLGTYTARWFGTVGAVESSVAEAFEVVSPADAAVTADVVIRLRRLIGERIAIGRTEADTRFTDQEIADTYFLNEEDLNKTLAELWFTKAAILGDFVDMSESGAVRNLSQMAKAAMAQAGKYEAKVALVDQAWQATYRVPGRTFSPYAESRGGSRLIGSVVIFEDPQRAWTNA